MSLYDLLLSGDLMVHDADETAAQIVSKLEIHGHANWRQAFPGHPYVAHFLRVHKSLAVSPTRVEPQGHLDFPNHGDPMFPGFLKSLEDFQGPFRPIKTHATVLVSDNIGGVVEHLLSKGQPFRLAQLTPEMPFDRLWVGCTPENPIYEPSVDGGLCIEVIPLAAIQMPAEAFSTPPPRPRDPKPGDMVRVVGRGFLVRDLDDVLRRLDQKPGPSARRCCRTARSRGLQTRPHRLQSGDQRHARRHPADQMGQPLGSLPAQLGTGSSLHPDLCEWSGRQGRPTVSAGRDVRADRGLPGCRRPAFAR
jgi:hypothetical protein